MQITLSSKSTLELVFFALAGGGLYGGTSTSSSLLSDREKADALPLVTASYIIMSDVSM
ncbi:hypothetical protein SPBRAN_883 [uncultured Candidatus Thioglobus sp.]|nr:hypothetical protein SPBRAN_883 [uncultured Candidatus Thioglobus sp.]